MASREDLYNALRNADKAGDVEGAKKLAQYIATLPAEEGQAEGGGMLQGAGNLLAGAVRGAGSIGATILYPLDKIGDLLDRAGGASDQRLRSLVTGKNEPRLTRNEKRRAAMDDALSSMGAETDSIAYGGAKLLAEIAGTAGVGGALAQGVGRVAPGLAAKAPAFLEAVASSGMRAGGSTGATNALLRAAGGGTAGAAGAGMVNPDDFAVGGAIGAVAPSVLKALGMAGRAVGKPFRGAKVKAGESMAQALDAATPADVAALVAQLRGAQEFVPGSVPTVAQALQTPQAGILQRVVHDSAGGGALRDRMVAQNLARANALESVAAVAPGGYQAARQDMGEAISRYAIPARKSAKAATRAAYEEVPQDEASLYLPDLVGIRDKYFGPGSFGGRAAVDQAVQSAQDIGTVAMPTMKAATDPVSARPKTLAQAVRAAGGLSLENSSGLRGEVSSMRGELKNLVRTTGGISPARMAEKMREAGYISGDGTQDLFDALRAEARGSPQFSTYASPERSWQAARDASMGEPPGAELVKKQVSLKELDNLRKSIGAAQRGAARYPERAAEAVALGDMKQALDDRVNEVVRGDGAMDENLPIAWADALDRARKLKIKEVEQFGTGPQRDIFRVGADGQPVVQGGEIAAKFWGNRPGVADDVESFRRLVADNPRLLGQFRSMITTEGAGTAGMDGKLAGKFAKWADAMQPGLAKAFEPDQVDMIKRIAQDIRRAEKAASAGMSRGSNTYQNAQNALSLGLLDNPLVSAAAGRVPVGGAGFNWLRETARESKARQLAALLANSPEAADALEAAIGGRPNAIQKLLANRDFQAASLRLAPALAADR